MSQTSWFGRGSLAPADSARIHAAYRTLARGLELAAIRNDRVRRWRLAALGAAACADVLEWRAIRSSRVSLVARLAIDVADIAFWAGPAKADLTTALTGLVAMDFEAGVAKGPKGLAVPALGTATAGLVRLLHGEAPDLLQGVPHVGAVIGGMTVRRGERVRMQRAEEDHLAERSAKAVRAFLAGQGDVAMGASTIIDQLQPVAVLLEADKPGSVLNQVRAGWRESLADQAQQHAVFLDSAIRMWQQVHNDHPDLNGYVDVAVDEGDGTMLVTGHQARALAQMLEDRDLRGRIRAAVVHRAARIACPGQAFSLVVNDSEITVPADPDATIARFNPAPAAFFFGAWAALMPTRPTDGALPMPLALACAAAYLGAGLTFRGRTPEESAPSAQWCATALSALQGAVCLRGCAVRRDPAGRHLLQGTYGIAPAGLLLVANRGHLKPSETRFALALLAAIATIAYAAAESPRSPADLAVALGHPLAAMIGMDVVARAAAKATERLTSELRREDEEVEATAFEAGRQHVLALAKAALEEAEAIFASRGDLDDEVRDSVSARLSATRQLAAELDTP